MGITDVRSPDMDQGMMDNTQDLTKMNEQMFGTTAEHHVHEPPSNNQHDQDEHVDRSLYGNKTASNWNNMKGSGESVDLTAQLS